MSGTHSGVVSGWWGRGKQLAYDQVGGPARLRVVLILAAILSLDGADKGTISATAGNLKTSLGISNTEVGLLVTVTALVGAIFTLPIGAITDRVRRTWLMGGTIATWGLAMLASGAAQSYLWLLLARLALGALTATAGPTVASLTGDYFPARDRSRMYGFILAGELLGTGFGFLVSGYLSAHLSWRYAFWWLAIPSTILAVVLWRLNEPARGGQSRLHVGDTDILEQRDVDDQEAARQREDEHAALAETRDSVARRSIRDEGIEPQPELVLHEDPRRMRIWQAVRYVLHIRTDVIIIAASALGYFFFTGLRTFALIFAQDHYGISKSFATSLVIPIGLGALVGVYLGGLITDRQLGQGRFRARVIIPMVALTGATLALAPAFWLTSLWIVVPLFVIGGGLLGAVNPPQDAARLDVIHPFLWGRAEGVRTACRLALEAAAPVTFGWVSTNWFGANVSFSGIANNNSPHTEHSGGLGYTFLLFLVTLLIAAGILYFALRTYPRDVATADASVEATLQAGEGPADDGPVQTDDAGVFPSGSGPAGASRDHGAHGARDAQGARDARAAGEPAGAERRTRPD